MKSAHDKIAAGLSDAIAYVETRERVARAIAVKLGYDPEELWMTVGEPMGLPAFRKLQVCDAADAAIAAMPRAPDAPQHEVMVYVADGSRTAEMRPVPMTAKGQRCCSICETPLDLPGRPWTRDCGGDCLACMAEVGDPDCVAAMPRVGWQPIATAIKASKSDDGWIRPSLFGIQQPWGWETWVGQCDNGDVWLGRSGDGECWETAIPTHWQPLPAPPAAAEETT